MIVHGDEVRGDKIAGDKTEVHIDYVDRGAQVIIGDVQIRQETPLEIPPPPEPLHPPECRNFVGREVELAYFTEKLESANIAIIAGTAGTGKSALAAQLARSRFPVDRIFWHAFREGESVETVCWQMAGFLAWNGQDALWKLLENSRLSGGEPPLPATTFDYIIQLASGKRYLFCFDDFQYVDEDPILNELVVRIRRVLAHGDFSLIVTTRRMSDSIGLAQFEPLTGLSLPDTRQLLKSRDLLLSDALINELSDQTGGNVQMLIMAVDALNRADNSTDMVARLAQSDDVERYLLNEVYRHLNPSEISVMSAIAVLMGYQGTRDAIEEIADVGSIQITLIDLLDRYLLTVHEGELGRHFGMHSSLQVFFYNILGRKERRKMHSRAGAFYELEEPNYLEATRHYRLAGDHRRSVVQATQHLWTIINQGKSQSLLSILGQFDEKQVDAQQWAQLNITRGQINRLLGNSELAHKDFGTAISITSTLPDSPEVRKLSSQSYEGMGRLLEHESPHEALDCLNRGLEVLNSSGDAVEAPLHIRIGSIRLAAGDYDAAAVSLKHGLDLLPNAPSQLRSSALLNMGCILSSKGDFVKAGDFYAQAMEISCELQDDFWILAIQNNMAIDKEISGDWVGALADYKDALAQAQRIGSVNEQIKTKNSLGILLTKMGDFDGATQNLIDSVQEARVQNNREDLIYGLHSLASLKLKQGDPHMIPKLMKEAQTLAEELEVKPMLAEIEDTWAQYYLQQSDHEAALDHALRSVTIAEDLDMKVEHGRFLRVLGQAYAANGDLEKGQMYLGQSVDVLADLDPYELACTGLVLGKLLMASDDLETARHLLSDANATFLELGADVDFSETKQLLSAL